MKKPIFVTKTFLPPIETYKKYVDIVWSTNQLTNQGPLVKQLEQTLCKYLGINHFHFVANGTLALQLALRSLDITSGEIITTPFSYVASVSSILWERCAPIFVDIDPHTLCIDPDKIEKAITNKTKAIMAVHVFGYPCNVDRIESIAEKHKLKVIYDGAHAFGAKYKGKSLLGYGDITTCSFHATKLFHTGEGGGLIVRDKKISDKLDLIKRFGHNGDKHYCLGINAKTSELHAAMGLANFPHINKIIASRKNSIALYDQYLGAAFERPKTPKQFDYNYAYYPIICKDEKQTLKIIAALQSNNIFPRRYFYPSLNTLPYLSNLQHCPISEDISKRILCLPLSAELASRDVKRISDIILNTL